MSDQNNEPDSFADDAADGSIKGVTAPATRRDMGREVEPENLRLSELLREELVVLPLVAGDRWQAIEELVTRMVVAGALPKDLADAATGAVREREAIKSSGWKYGVALPVGRLPGLRSIQIALGVSPQGVAFDCRDGLPARIVVLIFLPVGGYSRFVGGVEDLKGTFEDPLLREAILDARKASDVIDVIEEAEAWEAA